MKSRTPTSCAAVLAALSVAGAVENGCFSGASPMSSAGPNGGDFVTRDNGDGGVLPGPSVRDASAGIGSKPSAPRPVFNATTVASTSPPPISGGTLLVTHDGQTAVVADPDRDALYVVNVSAMAVAFTLPLQRGDEPGRLAEDGAGRVHVALRGGGALVTIDPTTGVVLGRRAVCPAPRGVAWDSTTDLVWVACATGELVAFPSAGGAAARSLVVERDLRDVIIQGGSMTVTKFRSAEVLRVASDGTVTRRDTMPRAFMSALLPAGRSTSPAPAQQGPPSPPAQSFPPPPVSPSLSADAATVSSGAGTASPHVAWRAVPGPAGCIVVAHQEESDEPIATKVPGAYGESGPIVESELTVVSSDGTILSTAAIPDAVLPVDVAASPDGTSVVVISAGVAFSGLSAVTQLSASTLLNATTLAVPDGQPIAVAYDGSGDVLIQMRDPATLWVVGTATAPRSIPLSAVSRDDTGHDVFHAQAGGLVACASCHPEGGDDGKVWLLDGAPRRTPSLRGTIAGTAPYHWPGDETNLTTLANDVYTSRMSGAQLDPSQMDALTGWIEGIPAPPAPSWVDASAAYRGKALFEGTALCASCHSGPKLTNNATVTVGTGGAEDGGVDTTTFQVPPLVGVGWRTPLMHDGCAATIADRFGKCATPAHGATAQLSSTDIADLTAYLESL